MIVSAQNKRSKHTKIMNKNKSNKIQFIHFVFIRLI